MNKLFFSFKKPKAVLISGNGRETAKEAIFKVYSRHFRVGKEIIICNDSDKNAGFFIKKSQLPILAVSRIGEYHPEKEFFAGEISEAREIEKLANLLPSRGYLILNFDDETVRDLKNKSIAHHITFGFGVRADVTASDIVLTQFPTLGTNFKINYEGNIVPCWLENLFGKDNIYAALAASSIGLALGLNLVKASQALKDFKGLPGTMQLMPGIKNSRILDDSENASPLSMLESLGILKEINGVQRKIAVLGDMLELGKHTQEAHKNIGRIAKEYTDVLIVVGPRAQDIKDGALEVYPSSGGRGINPANIFEFLDSYHAAEFIKTFVQKGDLVLVKGSQGMRMERIVEAILLDQINKEKLLVRQDKEWLEKK